MPSAILPTLPAQNAAAFALLEMLARERERDSVLVSECWLGHVRTRQARPNCLDGPVAGVRSLRNDSCFVRLVAVLGLGSVSAFRQSFPGLWLQRAHPDLNQGLLICSQPLQALSHVPIRRRIGFEARRGVAAGVRTRGIKIKTQCAERW